jgi:hypothetical protein
MKDFSLNQLLEFIVRAKAVTYVGDGEVSLSYRPGSYDLQYTKGDFAYLDSYFGTEDFIGQEVVYFRKNPIWVMNYYGRLLEPDLITAAKIGQVIRESLTQLYKEDRFLGGFEFEAGEYKYVDTNQGYVASFTGAEWIMSGEVKVYELVYHGGLVK